MNWSAFCTAIAAFVAAATGRPAVWAFEARQMFDGPHMVLQVIGEKVFGRDERHQGYDAGEDIIKRHTEGQRGVTVSVQCRSRDQRPGYDSKHYVSLVAAALGLESTIATLAEADISIIRVGNVTSFSTTVNNRDETIANVDVEFGAVARVTDADVDFFETFEVEQAANP